MSTKIYDGFKIEHQNFLDINKRLDKFRKQIFPEAERRLTERIVTAAVSRYDNQKITNGKRDTKFWDCFWEEEQIAFKEQEGNTRSRYDVSVSVFLLPIRDYTIGIIYSGEQDFKKAFFRKRFVKPYGYWNNTDPDEKVSEKEWEQRRKDWWSIGYTPPAEAGLTRDIVPSRMHPMMGFDKWKQFFPTKEERALSVATDKLFFEWLKKGNRKLEGKSVFKYFMEFGDWKESEEGQKRIAKKYKEVLPKVKEITMDKK